MSLRLKPILIVLLALLISICAWWILTIKPDTFTVTILHFNDLHGMYEPNQNGMQCTQDTLSNCVGGVSRLKTVIDQQRAQHENVLLLNAGDNFQGSTYFSLFGESVLAEVINFLGVNVMSLGNHEFDRGDATLSLFIQKINSFVVDSNIQVKENSTLSSEVLPYKIIKLNGISIGIIGAVTSDTPLLSSPSSDITFLNETESLSKAATALHEQSIDIIIAITHIGYKNDLMVAKTVPYLDVIVGGHSETSLTIGNPSEEGSYPTIINGPSGSPVAVVQTAPYGTELGEITITFDSYGTIREHLENIFRIHQEIKPDEQLQKYIDTLTSTIPEEYAQNITTISSQVAGDRETCRKTTCGVGNLVTDALLADQSIHKADIALINSGTIRTSLPAGELTAGDLLSALPFDNKVAFAEINGSELLTLFKKSITDVENESGAFLQFAGLQVHYNSSTNTNISTIELTDAENNAIKPDHIYSLVTSEYLANGGDGYPKMNNVTITDTNVVDVVKKYLTETAYYKEVQDGRLTNI